MNVARFAEAVISARATELTGVETLSYDRLKREIESLIAEAIREERERCAQVAEQIESPVLRELHREYNIGWHECRAEIGAKIRKT